MNLLARGALPPIDTLREQWRSVSLKSAWLYSDDWYHPEVDAVLRALSDGRSPLAACLRLGNARALAGCGIAETIDDLMCLFTAINLPTPATLVRSLTVGWVHTDFAGSMPTSCVDPGSGLHTRAHLAEQLRDICAMADQDGPGVLQSHVLLMIDVGVERLTFDQQAAREASIGEILRTSLAAGQPIASLGAGRYTALVPAAEDLTVAVGRLRRRIVDGAATQGIGPLLRTPPRLWTVDIPVDPEEGVALVLTMSRHAPHRLD